MQLERIGSRQNGYLILIDLTLIIPCYYWLLRSCIRVVVSYKVCRSMVKGESMDLYTFKVNQTYPETTCIGYEGLLLLPNGMLASNRKGKGGRELTNE